MSSGNSSEGWIKSGDKKELLDDQQTPNQTKAQKGAALSR